MANSVQYAVAQVTPYLVATAKHLRHFNYGLAELKFFKVEWDKLNTKV